MVLVEFEEKHKSVTVATIARGGSTLPIKYKRKCILIERLREENGLIMIS